MGGGGGGVNILWFNILTPPPPKNIQEQYFVNGIQWQLSFKTQNIYISRTILLGGWHFFLMGCRGGVNILWYNILTPPPSKNILEQYLYMESSDNLALTHKLFTFHRQYYSVVELSFLWDVGGEWSIYYGKIYWPPPPTPKNFQELYFVNGIQWQLSF